MYNLTNQLTITNLLRPYLKFLIDAVGWISDSTQISLVKNNVVQHNSFTSVL